MKVFNREFSLVRFSLAFGIGVGGMWLLVGLGIFLSQFGRINTTPSEPLGIYTYANGAPGRGEFVSFPAADCPIQAEWIPALMLKNIAAVSGDRVVVNDDGVFINSHFVTFRPPKPQIKRYFFDGTLGPGQVFLLAPNINSFDSRHYGPVSSAHLRRMVPLWTF